MANMNFRMVMSLQAQAFKKGIAEVRNEIHNFRNSLLSVGAAIGAGMGFGDLIGKMKETTKQLSVARATLENVSYSTKDAATNTKLYAQNLDFAEKLAKKYHQSQIEIIDNFAQFHAACQNTNVSLEDQKKIYESLTRATAYFHMSESRAKDMMIAITQMMSKGKVSSEELRRQLGNALPGAFNLMAKAIGVSTAELEKLLKAGKLASGPALIKFAEELNKQTRNISFDSVQLKLNDLQNAWTKLVDNSGFEQFFKDFLDWGTNSLNRLAEVFSGFFSGLERSIGVIKTALIGLASAKIISDFTSAWNKAANIWATGQKQKIASIRTEMKKLAAEAASVVKGTPASISTNKDGTKYINNGAKLNAQQQQQATAALSAYNKKLIEANTITANITKQTTGLRIVWTGVKGVIQGVGQFLKANVYAIIAGAIIGAVSTLISKWHEYNKALKESVNIGKQRKADLDDEASSYKSKEALIRTELSIVNDVKKSENERIAALNLINEQLGLVGDKQLTIKDGMDKINAATDEWLKRLARGAKMEAYTKELGEVSIAADKAEKAVNDLIYKINYQLALRSKPLINRKTIDDIYEKGDDGVYKVSAKNRAKYGLESLTGLRRDLDVAYNQLKGYQNYLQEINTSVKSIQEEMVKNGDYNAKTGNTITNTDLVGDTKEKPEKVIDKYNGELAALKAALKENRITQDDYNKQLIDLIERYLEKYIEAGGKTDNSWYQTTLKDYNGIKGLVDEFKRLKDVYKVIDNYKKDKLGAKNDNELDNAATTVYGDIIEAAFDYLKDKGIDTAKLTADELIQVFIEEIAKSAPQLAAEIRTSFAEAEGTINRLNAEEWGKIYKEYGTDYNKKGKKEDRYRDYKYTDTQKYDSQIKDIDAQIKRKQDVIEKLQKLADNGSEKAINDINNLKQEIEALRASSDDLEKKATYSEYLDYLDDLQDKISKGLISTMKDFSEVIDRTSSAWDDLEEAMEGEDSTWFDKIKAMVNWIVQFATTMGTLTSAIKNYQELAEKLKNAKTDSVIGDLGKELGINSEDSIRQQREALASIGAMTAANEGLAASQSSVAAATALETEADTASAAAKAMKATATQGATAADATSIGVSTASAAASTTESTADSVSAAAKMAKWFAANPLLGAAIAATVVAGVAGVVSSLKKSYGKFANGGIVGYGTASGDNTLARVNKGEMVLNHSQQKTLFDIANGKAPMGGGEVNFRIKGADLVGTLKNYNNKIKG